MSMFKIYKTIQTLYVTRFKGSTKEFKAGYEMCAQFLRIGIEQSDQFSSSMRIMMLERKNKKLRQENAKLRLVEKIQSDLLGKRELINFRPTDKFKEFALDTALGAFSIVINAEREVVFTAWLHFVRGNTFKTLEECKSKFLNFLNQLAAKDIIAYKDSKTARREMSNDNRETQR